MSPRLHIPRPCVSKHHILDTALCLVEYVDVEAVRDGIGPRREDEFGGRAGIEFSVLVRVRAPHGLVVGCVFVGGAGQGCNGGEGPAVCEGGNDRGGGYHVAAEYVVQGAVDVAFDVDGEGCCVEADAAVEDLGCDSEVLLSVLGVWGFIFLQGGLPACFEVADAVEEDDVFAGELASRGVFEEFARSVLKGFLEGLQAVLASLDLTLDICVRRWLQRFL